MRQWHPRILVQGALTIVLPVRSRHQFTPRFLRHAGHIPVIVAHGDDSTLADYWAKMINALEAVKTRYAMVADNDDFAVPDMLTLCAEFLDDHPDFVAASGRVAGIWIWPDKIAGPFCHRTRLYAPFDEPAIYDQDQVSERVLAGFRNSWSYYAVYRTEALRDIWCGVQALDLKDLMVHEKFCAMTALRLGKIICFGEPSYVRQYGTSERNTDIVEDWDQRLNRGDWVKDMTNVLDVMTDHGVNRTALRAAWGLWYENHLNYHFGWNGQLRRTAKLLAPRLAYAFQHRHQFNPWAQRLVS